VQENRRIGEEWKLEERRSRNWEVERSGCQEVRKYGGKEVRRVETESQEHESVRRNPAMRNLTMFLKRFAFLCGFAPWREV
jgi:hypothetical protein